MGACSGKPKTAEFEEGMHISFNNLQDELARKGLDDKRKGGCNTGLKSLKTEQETSSECSLQHLSTVEKDVIIEAEKKPAAGFSLVDNEKVMGARFEGTCDAKHEFVAEDESQMTPIFNTEIDLATSKLQKEISDLQELQTRPNLENIVEPHIESQKGDFRDMAENIGEDIELQICEGEKLKINAKEGREKTAACIANSATSDDLLIHNGEGNEIALKKPSKAEVNEAQRHNSEEAVEEKSVLIINKTHDSDWTTLDFLVTPSKLSSEVKQNDATCAVRILPAVMTGMPEGSTHSSEKSGDVETKVIESFYMDPLSSVVTCMEKQGQLQVEEAHMATCVSSGLQCHFTELHARLSVSTHGVQETERPLNVLVYTNVEEGSIVRPLVHEASNIIPAEDDTQVAFTIKKPYFQADINESSNSKALNVQHPSFFKMHKDENLLKVLKEASDWIQGEEYANKQEPSAISPSDQMRASKVVEVIDYDEHSAASQPFKPMEEVHVVEPAKLIFGKDIAPDIDEMLEKLASEFERQETLSSSVL